MNILQTRLPGCVAIEPDVHGDARGFFYEAWNAARFAAHGLPAQFVQHNVSRSQRGVLRGLHYQWPGNPQGKLVGVLEGEVYDVAVDLRRDSPTFGQHAAAILSARLHVPGDWQEPRRRKTNNRPSPARTRGTVTPRNATIADFMPPYDAVAAHPSNSPRPFNTYRGYRREFAKRIYRKAGR